MDPDEEKLLRRALGEEPADDSAALFNKKAKLLIWLVAAGFFLVGVMNIAAYWLKSSKANTSVELWRCLYLSIPIVIAVVIVIKTSALVRRIEEWLEQ